MNKNLKFILIILLVVTLHSAVVCFGFFELTLNEILLVWGVTSLVGFVMMFRVKTESVGYAIIVGCGVSFFTSISLIVFIISGFC